MLNIVLVTSADRYWLISSLVNPDQNVHLIWFNGLEIVVIK